MTEPEIARWSKKDLEYRISSNRISVHTVGHNGPEVSYDFFSPIYDENKEYKDDYYY